jgi:predicted dehydrogenase
MASYVSGKRIVAVMADFATFVPVRKKPLGPVDTFASGLLKPGEYREQTIDTEDYAGALLRFEEGARGVMIVCQLSAGRKNRLSIEISGSGGALAWNGEQPNELWIGHRSTPNELMVKDPALMTEEARQWASYPAGHAEGFPDTFKQLYRAIYSAIDGDSSAEYPTFEDGAASQRLLEAVGTSAREQRWVEVITNC